MNHGRGPGRMKRSRLNFKFGARLSEVLVFAAVDKGVVLCYRIFKRLGGHRLALMLIHDICREFGDAAAGEKISVFNIYVWRRCRPALALRRFGIEDSPDGTASVVCFTGAGHGRI